MLDGRKGLIRSRDDRNLRGNGHIPCCGLVTKMVQICHCRPDEGDTILPQCLSEILILRQETVSGMDRLNTILDTNIDNCVNVQVLSDR